MRLTQLLVVVPHSGLVIPEEIDPDTLSPNFPALLENVDWYTNYLYDFRDILGNRQAVFPYCSLLLEANRHPDILDDCVPKKDVFGRPLYKQGKAPADTLRVGLSDKYLLPFHQSISDEIMAGCDLLLDGHSTISANGVADNQIDLMNYQHTPLDERPVFFSPPVYIETYAKALRKRLPEITVTVNDSEYHHIYGHVCAHHCINALKKSGNRVPGILQETNHALYMNADGSPDIARINRLRRAFAEALYETVTKVRNIGQGSKILDVPITRQTFDYDCGAKALQTLLVYYGLDIREDVLMKELGTSKVDGSSIRAIRQYAKNHGFQVSAHQNMSISDLKHSIDEGVPVLVLLQAWAEKKLTEEEWLANDKDGHYVIVIGYGKDKIIFEDPSSFNRTWLTNREFLTRWHDINLENGQKIYRFGMILHGQEPVEQTLLHME
jgi:predicted double-glycine peptidase